MFGVHAQVSFKISSKLYPPKCAPNISVPTGAQGPGLRAQGPGPGLLAPDPGPRAPDRPSPT